MLQQVPMTATEALGWITTTLHAGILFVLLEMRIKMGLMWDAFKESIKTKKAEADGQ